MVYGGLKLINGRRRGTREEFHPFPETKISGANANREIFIFPVQLTTSRIGNVTRLIHTLARCVAIHTYINTVIISHTFSLATLLWICVATPKYAREPALELVAHHMGNRVMSLSTLLLPDPINTINTINHNIVALL